MVTRKILRKFAFKKESSAGVYTAPDILVPVVSGLAKQTFQMIEDDSIVGDAFKTNPVQGVRAIEGNHEVNADVNTLPFFLEMITGSDVSSTSFSANLTKNEKTCSLCVLDGVKTNKYAGIALSNAMFKSEAEGKLKISFDMLSNIAETRDDTAFPTINTYPGVELLHQHMTGSGYFRLADQSDELAAGDNITDLKSLEFGLNYNMMIDPVNSQTQLAPVSQNGECSFKIQLAQHAADTYLTYRDNRTLLQAEALYYGSATAQLKIQIPNIVVTDVVISEDEKARMDVTFAVARNGLGTNYTNSNMAFSNIVKFTYTNS